MKSREIIVLFTTIMFIGCQTIDSRNYEQPVTRNKAILQTTIGSLNIEHPELDVEKNTSNDDFRFICVCGYACYTPGVEKEDLALTKKYGIRCLEGTSDVIEGVEHGKLIQTARKYAETYNMILLKKLKSKTET